MPPTVKSFKAGEVLFKEGDPPRSIFIIRKGTVSVCKIKNKQFAEVGRVEVNEVLGELSFFDNKPRSATAVALVEVETLELSFDVLEQAYNGVPEYMRAMVTSMADRLRQANEQISLLKAKKN